MEAAGGGGTTLTSAAEPYNASGKHEAHMAGSNCCPDFAATAGLSAYASRNGKSHGNKFPNPFRNTVSIKSVASARRQASPSFFCVQATSNRRPDIVQVLSEARLAKHISSLRRTACRSKISETSRISCGTSRCRCGIPCGDGRWRCGILAANIVGACGTVCGDGRGWLRRTCGKISSKPAADVVDQQLTHVRGKASPLFSWVPSECAPAINHALFWLLGVGCWLRRKRAGTFVAGCRCRASLAESVAYALSGSARPHCDCLPRHDPQSIASYCHALLYFHVSSSF